MNKRESKDLKMGKENEGHEKERRKLTEVLHLIVLNDIVDVRAYRLTGIVYEWTDMDVWDDGTSHPRIAHGQRYPMPCLK